MKYPFTRTLIVSSILLNTYGCHTPESQQLGGGLIGGGTGALIGAQIGSGTGQLVGVAAGTLLGALVGSEIAQHIVDTDHTYADEAAQNAFITGKTINWRNPATHHKGNVRVGPRYWDEGEYCRDYTQTITIGNRKEIAHGRACRSSDGTWVICN